MDTQNFIRDLYRKLDELNYSEHNIVELLHLYKEIEKHLVNHYPECKCLVYIRATRNREIDDLVQNSNLRNDVSFLFKEAKKNLLSDLDHYCLDIWNPSKR